MKERKKEWGLDNSTHVCVYTVYLRRHTYPYPYAQNAHTHTHIHTSIIQFARRKAPQKRKMPLLDGSKEYLGTGVEGGGAGYIPPTDYYIAHKSDGILIGHGFET